MKRGVGYSSTSYDAYSSEIDTLRIIERAINRGEGYAAREQEWLRRQGQVRLLTADNSPGIDGFDNMKLFSIEGLYEVCHRVAEYRKDYRYGSCARQVVVQVWRYADGVVKSQI